MENLLTPAVPCSTTGQFSPPVSLLALALTTQAAVHHVAELSVARLVTSRT
ncbi:hypothetical protein HBB16_01995 [Pseudonocardia sp. MCCB 268]|nr:hypothetical protein [Pseudonocardia cytotoxica]